MNFSIIGTGFIFPKHVNAIEKMGGRIVDITNISSNKSWEEVVRNPKTDCIVILTPNDLHFPIALEAAKNGKIVLCEKPLTIGVREAEILSHYPNIYTVLQLRHHPLVKKIKNSLSGSWNTVEMDISINRDEEYFNGWKGEKERSGGILFMIGIHYFDILFHLFNDEVNCNVSKITDKSANGTFDLVRTPLMGTEFKGTWKINLDTPKNKQRRILKINGTEYDFSSQDNLAYEDLHYHVYRDLLEGKCINAQDVLGLTLFIEKLYDTQNH